MLFHQQKMTLLLFIGVSLIALSSCLQREAEMPIVLPTPLPTPSFLNSIHPEPSSILRAEIYALGPHGDDPREEGFIYLSDVPHAICIGLDGAEVVHSTADSTLRWQDYPDRDMGGSDYLERSQLLIDGKVLETITEPDSHIDFLGLMSEASTNLNTGEVTQRDYGIGPFEFCWEVPLEQGLHQIEYLIRSPAGEELSYSWQFYLTD